MIWIDFVIIGIIFIYMIKGFLRGLRVELFSLIFWLLACVISLSFSGEFSVFLNQSINHPIPKIAASFSLLFLMTLLIGRIIRLILSLFFKPLKLTYTDHLGGLILGTIHGMFFVVILVMLAGLTSLPNDLWWTESNLLPPYQNCALWIRNNIPSGLAEYIHYR